MKKIIVILSVLLALPLGEGLGEASLFAGEPVEWGYYSGDFKNLYCTGIQGQTKFNVAIFIPGNDALKGGKIQGLRIPIHQKSSITKVNGWIANKLAVTMKYAVKKDGVWADLPDGYQKSKDKLYYDLTFDEPYDIPESGCYVGYQMEVNSSSATPLIFDYGNYNANGAYVVQQDRWQTFGSNIGVSVLKAMVTVAGMKDAAASFAPLNGVVTLANQDYQYDFTVVSNGDEAVSNIEYTIDVNGVKDTRTADVSIAAGLQQEGTVKVDVKAPTEAKYYNVKLNITKVNGKDNAEIATVTTSEFKNLGREVQRKSLVEELTGQKCNNCPLGFSGMQLLDETFGECFVGVAVHQYSSAEIMYFQNYRVHGMTKAPQAVIDGKILTHPYLGTANKSKGIADDFKVCNAFPAHAEIALSAYWTDDKKTSVNVQAYVEGMTESTYTIAYALTVNGLHGTTTDWAQLNGWYGTSPIDDYSAKWFRGGEYAQEACYPVYNDVLIASSYNISKQNLASPLGTLTYGTPKYNSYTMSLPTKAGLRDKIDENKDKVYAVAIVFDRDGKIAQANKVLVKDVLPTGIGEVEVANAKANAKVVYNLAGQIVGEDYKGIVIVNGKKMLKK